LARTRVHNTLEIEDSDQMQLASRFLWLHWAQAKLLPEYSGTGLVAAEHTGYAKIAMIHRRSLASVPTGWRIVDDLLPKNSHSHGSTRRTARLQWLFPDVPFCLDENQMHLYFDEKIVTISIRTSFADDAPAPTVRVIRAGEVLAGPPAIFPTLGWYSPTYSVKQPALSLQVNAFGIPPFRMTTEIILPDRESGTINSCTSS
jgi:hypothetical protein